MQRQLREKLDYIRAQGLIVAAVETGVHYKIRVRRPDEVKTYMLVAAKSSASTRGAENFKAMVRRVARR